MPKRLTSGSLSLTYACFTPVFILKCYLSIYLCHIFIYLPLRVQVSGLPIAGVMDTWTKQMGYPVLDLSVSESNAKLTQKRFLLDPKANASLPTSPFGLVMDKEIITMWRMPPSKICFGCRYKWTIPVKWHALKSEKNMITIFAKEEGNARECVITMMSFKMSFKNAKQDTLFKITKSYSTHLAAHLLLNM